MVVVVSTIAFILSVLALVFAAKRPYSVLYALAAVVSLVGINIHIGITFYLSRIVIILFILSILVRLALDRQIHFPARFLSKFTKLFALILFFQLVSALFSAQIMDGLTQIFIYMSVMAIFIAVIMVGTSVEIIIKAIKIYLVTGLVQGLYGIYMVIGGPFSLPTYQTLMAGIPTANDHTVDGYVYSGTLSSFRALGFFPSDMSHYAGYMVGVLILAIAYMAYDRRFLLPYFVILFGGLGLLLSFSRSGILAFVVFGFPALLFLLSRVRPSGSKGLLSRTIVVRSLLGLILLVVIGLPILSSQDIELPNFAEIISTRFEDLFNPGQSDTESMGEHLATRLAGLDALASSPLIGVGLGVNASPWYSETYQRGWGGSHSHHLDILGQTGLIGAGLQFLFMALVGRFMWRGLFVTRENSLARYLLAGLLAAYIAILFGNLMYHYFIIDFVWFLMGCGIALSRLLILEANKKEALPTLVTPLA